MQAAAHFRATACLEQGVNLDKTGEKRINPRVRTVIVMIVVLVIFAAGFIVANLVFDKFEPQNRSVIVYKTGNETVVRINGFEKNLGAINTAEIKADSKSGRIFYTVPSSYSDGLFDLYYVEKHRSEIKAPKIIDYGIEGSFDVVSGKIYYLKKNENQGAFDGCICDPDKNKIETFSGNVNSIYAIDDSDKIFFTKLHGENLVLYSYSEGTPSEMCRDIKTVVAYKNTERPHILYEKKSTVNTGMSELYIAYTDTEPELICDNTYSVMYDHYKPGGNLYYFTTGEESISWSYVIADHHSESDKTVTKPSRLEYFDIFGISEEYNNALTEYHNKLLRDEIREALNQTMEEGGFVAPIFNAFAYNSEGIFKITEDIDPASVYTVSAYGKPKMIYESMQVVESDVDLTTLVEYSRRNNIDTVIDYAKSIVNDSIKSNGMAYSAYGENGAVTSALDGYDKSRTLFSFSDDGNTIYAFVRSAMGETLDLCSNSLDSNLMPSAVKSVDTGITSYRFVEESVVYLKSDVGKDTGDVFAYDGTEKTKVSNAVNAFTVENSEDVIVLKQHSDKNSQPTADYYFCSESGEKLIGNDVIVSSFIYNDKGYTAYISETDEKSTLCVYGSGKSTSIDEGVTEILLFE